MARPPVRRGATDVAASHLLFTVKAWQIQEAAAEFSKMADRRTTSAVFSNGLGVCENFPLSYRERGVVRGLVNTGAEIVSPGHLNQFGALDITLAPGNAQGTADARRWREFLENSGIRAHLEQDGKEAEWRKAVANAVINPLGAVLELKNGALLDTPSAVALVDVLAKELQTLIDAEGMVLDALGIVRETARATAGNRNSMWQDLRRGRRSEIREVTGRLLECADARGILLSAHKSLYERVLSLEKSALRRRDGDARVDIGGWNP